MIGGIEHLVGSGPLLLAIPVALAAGAVTFLSPCCLPLVPGYLSYLTGMSGAAVRGKDPAGHQAATAGAVSVLGSVPLSAAGAGSASWGSGGARGGISDGPAGAAGAAGTAGTAGTAAAEPAAASVRGRAVLGTLLFVLGFAAVFATEGVFFGSLGAVLRSHTKGLTQVLGVVIILLGLLFVGAFDRFTFSGRIFRPQFRPRAGLVGAPLLGVVFGLGWTPCIGPTLLVVLSLSATTGTAGRGALLAFAYALGLGIPFLMVAFAFQRGISLFGFARRHARLVTQIGGAMLIAVGLLEVTGAWGAAVAWLQTHWATYNAPI